jgi:tRNA G10  N-methylase Trm11
MAFSSETLRQSMQNESRYFIQYILINLVAPYGVREATERIGTLKTYTIKEEHLEKHYPAKIEYSLSEIFKDLIDFCAQRLTLGGRMVCWIPISR